MEEKTQSRLFRTLQILIPLVGVAVGITGVLLTVAARKKELTCTLVNSTRLVSENLGGIHPDMRVEFHGQAIFSLTKMTFELRNTGAAAIMAKDILEPVRLAFPSTTKLMSANVERTTPLDLAFSAHAFPERGTVELDFPLLNRGDEATFSIYVFNSEAQKPALEGRVVDVPQLIYSETSTSAARQNMWPFQSHATRAVIRWVLVSIYGALTALFLGICVAGIGSYVRYLPWKRKWKRLYLEAMKDVAQADRQQMNARAREEENAIVPEEARPVPQVQRVPDERVRRAAEIDALIGEEARLATIGDHIFLRHDQRLHEELRKRSIPEHPNPMVESLGGLMGLSAAMLALALVCSTTSLVVFRAFSG